MSAAQRCASLRYARRCAPSAYARALAGSLLRMLRCGSYAALQQQRSNNGVATRAHILRARVALLALPLADPPAVAPRVGSGQQAGGMRTAAIAASIAGSQGANPVVITKCAGGSHRHPL